MDSLLSLFVADAWAQAGGQGQGSSMQGLLMLVVLMVVMYFMLIRPQAKRAKAHKEMVSGVQKGDEIVTNGGVLGRITDVGEAFVTVEIADGVQVKVQRQMIAQVLPKGTIKAA
jgi:preprotein translocase subunit YajC